ncbi:hypothetical protein CsSME_00006507 [Camellia sinensis var. sinensis]
MAKEVGGWRPVLYGRGRQLQRYDTSNPGIHTLFVDNIPLSMNPKGLYAMFMKFGVVRDVFIPNKTRKTTRSRFGFVKDDCPVVTDMVVQKANGVWCDDKALRVKFAEYAKDTSCVRGVGQSAQVGHGSGRGDENGRRYLRKTGSSFRGMKTYAEVFQAGNVQETMGRTVDVVKVGKGWLYDSLIVKLKSFYTFSDFKKAICELGPEGVAVRK